MYILKARLSLNSFFFRYTYPIDSEHGQCERITKPADSWYEESATDPRIQRTKRLLLAGTA